MILFWFLVFGVLTSIVLIRVLATEMELTSPLGGEEVVGIIFTFFVCMCFWPLFVVGLFIFFTRHLWTRLLLGIDKDGNNASQRKANKKRAEKKERMEYLDTLISSTLQMIQDFARPGFEEALETMIDSVHEYQEEWETLYDEIMQYEYYGKAKMSKVISDAISVARKKSKETA